MYGYSCAFKSASMFGSRSFVPKIMWVRRLVKVCAMSRPFLSDPRILSPLPGLGRGSIEFPRLTPWAKTLSPLPGLVTSIGLFPRLTPWATDLSRLPALAFVVPEASSCHVRQFRKHSLDSRFRGNDSHTIGLPLSVIQIPLLLSIGQVARELTHGLRRELVIYRAYRRYSLYWGGN